MQAGTLCDDVLSFIIIHSIWNQSECMGSEFPTISTQSLLYIPCAVRDLQFKYNKTKRDHMFTTSQIYRVIVSQKEENFIQMLNAKSSEIDVAIQRNTESTSSLLEETQKRDAEIESVFATLRKRLGEQEKVLRNKVNEESVSQLKELKTQKRMLEAYQQSIAMATKEQKMLILDPNIDSVEREMKIGQITSDTIDSIDANKVETEVSAIEFVIDEPAVNEVFTLILGTTVGIICFFELQIQDVF